MKASLCFAMLATMSVAGQEALAQGGFSTEVVVASVDLTDEGGYTYSGESVGLHAGYNLEFRGDNGFSLALGIYGGPTFYDVGGKQKTYSCSSPACTPAYVLYEDYTADWGADGEVRASLCFVEFVCASAARGLSAVNVGHTYFDTYPTKPSWDSQSTSEEIASGDYTKVAVEAKLFGIWFGAFYKESDLEMNRYQWSGGSFSDELKVESAGASIRIPM